MPWCEVRHSEDLVAYASLELTLLQRRNGCGKDAARDAGYILNGLIRIAMTLFDGIDPLWMPWLKSSVAVAILLVLVAGTKLVRERTERTEATPA